MSQKPHNLSFLTIQEIEDEIEDLYYDLFDAQTEGNWKLADKIQRDIRELEAEERVRRRGQSE